MKLVNYRVLDPKKPALKKVMDEIYRDKAAKDVARFTPEVNVYEDEGNFGITISLPGMQKENIKIEIHDDILFVSGEKKQERIDGVKHHLEEISYGVFSRSFHIPKEIDQENIDARYEEGLLKLQLPKNKKLIHKYQIKVK